MISDFTKRLNLSLFLLRIGVFIVMGIWAIDKFVNPAHTAGVFAAFYSVQELGPMTSYIMGVIQSVIVLAFVAGVARTWSYGLIVVIHGISTLISFNRYMEPWSNLLFFAAWPMLAAAIVLFLLREYDGWTIGGASKTVG